MHTNEWYCFKTVIFCFVGADRLLSGFHYSTGLVDQLRAESANLRLQLRGSHQVTGGGAFTAADQR